MTGHSSSGNGANGYGLNKIFVAVVTSTITTAIIFLAGFTIKSSISQARIDERVTALNAELRAQNAEIAQQVTRLRSELDDMNARLIRIEERTTRTQ
jgi:cell division protein FtsB